MHAKGCEKPIASGADTSARLMQASSHACTFHELLLVAQCAYLSADSATTSVCQSSQVKSTVYQHLWCFSTLRVGATLARGFKEAAI